MDSSLSPVEIPPPVVPSSSKTSSELSKRHHSDIVSQANSKYQLQQEKINFQSPGLATPERIPTSTWGPFTIVVVVFLVLLTCFILNCNRIRRKVSERRMDRLGRSGPFTFERRHKELQEADLEWNSHPPMVFTNEKPLSTPESTYSSSSSSSSGNSGSDHSSLSRWSSTNSTIAQKHHYRDKDFIKNQPPSVQLRLTLENASASNLPTVVQPAHTSSTPMTIPHQQQGQQYVRTISLPPSSSVPPPLPPHINNKRQNYNPTTVPSNTNQQP